MLCDWCDKGTVLNTEINIIFSRILTTQRYCRLFGLQIVCCVNLILWQPVLLDDGEQWNVNGISSFGMSVCSECLNIRHRVVWTYVQTHEQLLLCVSSSLKNHFIQQYNPEDNSEHHTRRRENLKSHFFKEMKVVTDIRRHFNKSASYHCLGQRFSKFYCFRSPL
jgi:hypothetical protein